MDFAGRHILVTGASTGIGLATARMLARRGARVSMLARSADKLAEEAVKLEGEGATVGAFSADVADGAALLEAISNAETAFGPVEGLFANAASMGEFGPLTECPDDLFESVIRTNLTSVFRALKCVLPGMIARGAGSIVITGSLASERGMPGNVAYGASKHGVLGLARAAASEAAAHGVRVNAVLPGLIETPMLAALDPAAPPEAIRAMLGKAVPQGRVGSPDEVAELVCFLLSDAASHITAQSMAVDGGMLGTLYPR